MRRQTLKALAALLVLSTPLLTVTPALAQPAPQSGSMPTAVGGLAFVPLKGQPDQQQWSDRYACHDWARGQSGYDPTPRAGAAASADSAGLGRYRRAMSACMEARGYRVQNAAPPTPAYPPSPSTAPGAPMAPAPPPPTPLWVHQSAPFELRYHPLTVQFEGGPTASTGDALRDGWNAGVGLTWFPTSTLPLGLRVDGSYSRLDESYRSLYFEAASTGADVLWGHEDVYGGDADLQLNLPMTPQMNAYLLGGIGWYREQTYYRQFVGSGFTCGYFCGPPPGYATTLENGTTDWKTAWNAGAGFEFALQDPVTLFVEARFLRISPGGSRSTFVPLRFGVRF